MYNKELAVRVIELRGEMSQRKFADLIGVSNAGLRSMESGKYMPTARTLMNMKKKLGVSYEYLIEGEGEAKINMDLATAQSRIDELKAQLQQTETQLKSLSSENERLTKIVDKLLQ